MESEDTLTMGSLMERTIRALTVNDAPQLRELLRMADRVEAPRQGQQVLETISRRQLLAAVLNETACNLRLLQRMRARAHGEDRAYYGQLWS